MNSLPHPGVASDIALLLNQLREADGAEAGRIEREITREWAKSGSAAMDFLLGRGRDALDLEEYDRAIGHFTALIDHAPDFAEGYHMRAQAYFHTGKLGPALGDLQSTLRLNPDHFGALRGLAVIFETLNDPARALAAYEMVLALHPNDAQAREGAARLQEAVRGRDL